MWTNNAKGKHYDGDYKFTKEEIADLDFVVCEPGEAFTDNIQTAHDNGKVFFAFVPHMLEDRHVNYGPNPEIWPVDTDPLIKLLDRYVRSGGVNRVIHGIVVDCSATKDEYGNPFTTWWITEHAHFIMTKIYERYGIKTYLYMNNQPMAEAQGNVTNVQLLFNLMKKWGICSVDVDPLDGVVPAEGEKFDPPYDDPSLVTQYLWLYYTAAKPWKWLYMGTPEMLYKEVNFTPKEPVEPPKPPPPSEPEPIVINMLLAQNEEIAAIKAILLKHFKE